MTTSPILQIINPYIINKCEEFSQIIQAKEAARELASDERPSDTRYRIFTADQRFFFLLTKAFGFTANARGVSGDEDDPEQIAIEVAHEWEQLLRIRPHANFSSKPQQEINTIVEIAQQYGIIHLHEQIPTTNPKLIIGCGHGDPESATHTHLHIDADTIDEQLDMNPTWVGKFGKGLDHPTSRYLVENCRGYYQTIVNEGAVSQYKDHFWELINVLLRPGGFFLGRLHPNDHPIPLTCNLTIHCTELRNDEEGYRVITKAFEDGTHPVYISPRDIPLDVDAFFPLSDSDEGE